MMAIALRFDLYLHYLRKQSRSPNSKEVTKAKYEEPTGLWGERFWTSGSKETTVADATRFPKVYFKASLVGYTLAMIVTITVMRIYNHGQPALLYLVPGVLGALWGTAFVRGEWKLMWEYTEDGTLDPEGNDEKKDVKKEGLFGGLLKGEEVREESEKEKERKQRDKEEHAHHVFLFSLSEPKQAKTKLVEKGE
jgi:minor histocompatibility antigen H13